MKHPGKTMGLFVFVIFSGFLANLFFPTAQTEIIKLYHLVIPSPSPTPLWKEQKIPLSKEESATMSSDFFNEFKTASEAASTASMSQELTLPSSDNQAPTLSISGGPSEGAVIKPGTVCFPLWVSDNTSSLSAILTRYKTEIDPWTGWTTTLSPCISPQPGTHTFSVQIIDEAGNQSKEVKRTFRVE